MKKIAVFIIFAILFILPCFSGNTNGKSLVTSRNSSYYTYIYKLTNNQARKAYQNGIDQANNSCFTQLLDSFPTDSSYKKTLSVGHYLYVKSVENKLNLELKSVNDFSIRLLNNNADFSLMVFDADGNRMSTAIIHLKNKLIPFDAKTATYSLRGSNRKGLMEVELAGQSAFYNITRSNNQSSFNRGMNKVLYQSPVKYVAVPVNFVVSMPFDLYKTIKRHYRYRTIRMLTQPFVSIAQSISGGEPMGFVENIFYLFNHKYSSHFKGVAYFSQPKYRPNDTVRFQAYAFDKKNRPVTDSLSVELYSNGNKKLGYCKPVQPGIFVFEFPLKSALELQLDRNYSVCLRNSIGRAVVNGSFKYEDYELKSTEFLLRSEKPFYSPHQAVTLFCKGNDENDLLIPDARIELNVLAASINKFIRDRDFVPDTLWTHQQNLDPTGETKIVIPDSVFPQVMMEAKVNARFRTSSNEWQNKSVTFARSADPRLLSVTLVNDSVVFDYSEHGVSKRCQAEINIDDVEKIVQLPCKEKVNPLFNEYYITKDDLSDIMELQDESPMVNCLTARTKDSVWVSINNPRNIPLVYFVYKKNNCLFRGTEMQPKFQCKNSTKGNYFVSLHYLWAGKMKSSEYRVPLLDKELTIKAIEPAVVYPGQTTNVSVVVTDSKGKPVSNASVLAYGYTKKFKETSDSRMPYLGKNYPNRVLNNTFRENNEFDEKTNGEIALDWKKWHAKMQLDTIELYRFLYPQQGVYKTAFTTKGYVTQVAPFLVKNGALAPVNMLYFDRRPLYFDLTTTKQPYSFAVSPGWHKIELRTYKQTLSYDSLYLPVGCKTILSIDLDSINRHVRKSEQKEFYSPLEQTEINRYLTRIVKVSSPSYLYQDSHYELLEPNYYSSYIAGPLQSGFADFQENNGFHHSFNVEKGYSYEFFPNYFKMKSCEPIATAQMKTSRCVPRRNFAELAYTEKNVEENWQKTIRYIQTYTPRYDNPFKTKAGNGKLNLEYLPSTKNKEEQEIKNIIVLSISDSLFARIYNGSERWMQDFIPGKYKLIAILQDNRYFTEDSIQIRGNGTNFVRIKNKVPLMPDARINAVNSIIKRRIASSQYAGYVPTQIAQEEKQIATVLQQVADIPCTTGHKICGVVTDNKGEALPGVFVKVKGTSMGTVSNVDGQFCICATSANAMLTVSYIGYNTKEIKGYETDFLSVKLEESMLALNEVVVVGYGAQRKSNLTGSVATVQSTSVASSLSGRMYGIGVPGAGNNLQIRGMKSVDGKAPLYVIDGVVFEGDALTLNAADIGQVEVLKDAAAIAIYGSRAANGVVLITRKTTANAKKANDAMQSGIQQEGALRNHFSDMAFWKPALLTDANGVARFNVTFPDDVTSWNTYYYAYGAKATGQKSSRIKSFKPLIGTLAVPRFLLNGDVTNVIGKSINYTSDTIHINTSFALQGKSDKVMTHRLITSAIDTLTIKVMTVDTLKVSYKLQKEDGFSDGEKRDIPVLPVGTKEVFGQFWTLDNDTTFNITLNKGEGEATLVADAHPLTFALDELEHVRNYAYLCNEQSASKLKALLMEKKIYHLLNKPFPYDKDVSKLIERLEAGRTDNKLWGWWANTAYCSWISQHVVEALVMAGKAGYKMQLDTKSIYANLTYEYRGASSRDKMRILKTLMLLDSTTNYTDNLKQIDAKQFNFTERLELMELQQLCNIKPQLDTLMKWKKESYLRNVYWGTEKMSLFDDAISSTLLVYRIFKKAGVHLDLLPRMRNYILERRSNMHWCNTYESMKVLETILPDLVVNNSIPKVPQLKIEGAVKADTTAYPLKKTFLPENALKVDKKGVFPVYLTVWQSRWNADPVSVDKDFVVKTFFEKKDSVLKAGEAVTMVAEVQVKRASDFVMIEVPIPGGCSYEEKSGWMPHESHREYFKEKTVIFCDYLGEGTFQFKIKLMPRYTGVYTLNPARAELMYFPLMFGRNQLKKVEIK